MKNKGAVPFSLSHDGFWDSPVSNAKQHVNAMSSALPLLVLHPKTEPVRTVEGTVFVTNEAVGAYVLWS
jgi:hypothetical protein